MIAALFFIASLTGLQAPTSTESFTRFLFCHDFARGGYEFQCVELNPDGKGRLRYKMRDETRATEETEIPLALAARTRDRFAATLAETRFLADGAKYESSKKNIGDLGKKRVAVDTPQGHREAVFNYSDIKEVRSLAEFLDNLIEEELALSRLEAALKYQRLSVPEKLDRITDLIQTGRIVDPERAATVLDKVQADTKLLDSARSEARQIRNRLLKMK